MVSVIIPVYNVGKYIREALDSVINQTYTNLEIIIVDDGSTDESGEICDEYAQKDNRIIVIHQENKGIGPARNAGLEIMKGKYVAFLDPDDAYSPFFISSMLNKIEKEDADIVMCRYSACKTEGTLANFKSSIIMPAIKTGIYNRVDSLRAFLCGKISFNMMNKMFRSTLWDKIRFTKFSPGEDVDANFRAIDKCCKFVVLDQVLYFYRIRPGSIMTERTSKKICVSIRFQHYFNKYLEKYVPEILSEEQMSDRYNAFLFDRIKDYLACCGKKEEDWKILRRKIKKLVIIKYYEIGKENVGLKNRVSYIMMFICPRVLKLYLALFYGGKEFVWKCVETIKNR